MVKQCEDSSRTSDYINLISHQSKTESRNYVLKANHLSLFEQKQRKVIFLLMLKKITLRQLLYKLT